MSQQDLLVLFGEQAVMTKYGDGQVALGRRYQDDSSKFQLLQMEQFGEQAVTTKYGDGQVALGRRYQDD